MTGITERTIQLLLHRTWGLRARVAMPNYTPAGWHECDLWVVTKAGYMREYEIKLSVADFRADRNKMESPKWTLDEHGEWTASKPRTKHHRLAEGDPKGPVQFWYVTPAGLLAGLTLPTWAGLIEVEMRPRPSSAIPRLVYAGEPTNAPRLHSSKVGQSIIDHALGVCYYRYWDAIRDLRRSRDDHERALPLIHAANEEMK